MRKNNCELIRRELDELMLDEACSTRASEHLRQCASCREFHEQQTTLRRIVGSLGTVEAPADFDFRLRARLAQGNGSSVYWPFARRGLAVAAMLIVIATAAILVRNVRNQPPSIDNLAEKPEVHQPPAPEVTRTPAVIGNEPAPAVAGIVDDASPVVRKNRRPQPEYKKRSISSYAISSTRADLFNSAEPVGVSAAFPIDTALESFKVSLDDGRGNAKTISVPTISFGSQRVVQSANQFAPKRDW
jgi:hypothetical protein